MKLNIAYLLLLLVISPNLYAADAESSALAKQQPGFQSVKGLTEVVTGWEQKKIPSKWVIRSHRWQEQTKPLQRELATFIILGTDEKNPTDTSISAIQRPLNAYHFVESTLYSKDLLYTPLKNGAEKKVLDQNRSEKIVQFDHSMRSSVIGSHATSPYATDPNIFDANSKKGYQSQLVEALITTQEDYAQSKSEAALKRSKSVITALAHEMQKNMSALAIRERQVVTKARDVKALEAEIDAFNPAMSNEFVFYMNALMDIQQSEEPSSQPDIFNAGDVINRNDFILDKHTLTTKNKDGSEFVLDFRQFITQPVKDEEKKVIGHRLVDGRLPVEECAAQARKTYQSWRTSFGEPKDATKLRAVNTELMETRQALESLKPTEPADKSALLKGKIEILAEQRNDLFNAIREKVFSAAKELTSKDLAAYCKTVDNRKCLAFAQAYVSDEFLSDQSALVTEYQKLAHALLPMTAGARSTAQAITDLIGCDAPTAKVLAQYVDALKQSEVAQPKVDDKGKEEEKA